MSRARRRERDRQNREQFTVFSRHLEAASDRERGVAILTMWANAMVVTTLMAVLAVVVAIDARRIWRNRRSGVAGALRAGLSTKPVWVAGVLAIYQRAFKLWVWPAFYRRLHMPPRSSLPPSS